MNTAETIQALAEEAASQPAPDLKTADPEEAEYAVVEIFGHRRHAGRILEVERFGAKLLRIDVPADGDFARGYVSHFYGGAAIFSLTLSDLATVCRFNRATSSAGRYLPALDDVDTDEGPEF